MSRHKEANAHSSVKVDIHKLMYIFEIKSIEYAILV